MATPNWATPDPIPYEAQRLALRAPAHVLRMKSYMRAGNAAACKALLEGAVADKVPDLEVQRDYISTPLLLACHELEPTETETRNTARLIAYGLRFQLSRALAPHDERLALVVSTLHADPPDGGHWTHVELRGHGYYTLQIADVLAADLGLLLQAGAPDVVVLWPAARLPNEELARFVRVVETTKESLMVVIQPQQSELSDEFPTTLFAPDRKRLHSILSTLTPS